MPHRPNILFLQVDQLTASALRSYGNPICHAPTLDRLADQGVVFENAYCNFPLCAPSRFSMATGQLASRVGAYDNGAEFAADVPTYAHYLRAAGYQTALSGKMHFIGPDQFHGFEQRLTPDLYPGDFAWSAQWQNEGRRDTNDTRVVSTAGVCTRSVQIDYDDLVTRAAVGHLHDLAGSEDDRPFFLQVSYTHPHDPFLCQQKFWDMYEGVDIPMPRTPALAEADHDPHARRLLASFGMLGTAFDDSTIARAIRGYFGAISYVDSLIAQVVEALEVTGAAQNTVIVFTSDHGEMLGERGLWMKKHFYENAMRVPLLVAGPGIAPQRVSELCSLVDLLPTFNGLASVAQTAAPIAGVDLLTLTDRGNPAPSRTIHAEYTAESTPAPIFMVRRGAFKLISSSADGEMLFDLDADPEERRNLAGDPAHAETLAALRQEVLDTWNEPALTAEILASQSRRRIVRDAMGQGSGQRWNHGESATDNVPWYRGQQGYNDWAFDFD